MRHCIYILILIVLWPWSEVRADLDADYVPVARCANRLGMPDQTLRMVLAISPRHDAWFFTWVIPLMRAESGFNQAARSDSGAVGLMQVTPIALKQLAHSSYEQCRHLKVKDLATVSGNILAGTCYLDYLLDTAGIVESLLKYNGGSGATIPLARGSNTSIESAQYLAKILYWHEMFCEE